jgi:hypothetical protein
MMRSLGYLATAAVSAFETAGQVVNQAFWKPRSTRHVGGRPSAGLGRVCTALTSCRMEIRLLTLVPS